MVFQHGGLSQRHEQDLLKLKFDRSDFPFVAVASRSKDKLLVSEDSDYTPAVRNYLEAQLKIQVLSAKKALDRASGDL